MIRRAVLASLALVTTGVLTGQAFAEPPRVHLDPSKLGACVGGSNDPQGPMEGVCVWVPRG